MTGLRFSPLGRACTNVLALGPDCVNLPRSREDGDREPYRQEKTLIEIDRRRSNRGPTIEDRAFLNGLTTH